MSLDVFISYSRVDQPFVVALDAFLTELGISVWFDKKSLLPGKKWEEVIDDQIQSARVFLTCMSQAGLDKRGYFHVEQNLAAQAALRIPPEQLYIMPVMLGECTIPRQFRQYHVVNLADDGAIEMLLLSLSEALERLIEASSESVANLRTKLLEHLGSEATSNQEFESRFMSDEITFQDSAGLIQRIANSADQNRLKVLLKLRALPQISYAEQQALDIAITNVKRGIPTENLQALAVAEERQKIAQMSILNNESATLQLQVNKYARFTSRTNSPVYQMAEANILELITTDLASMGDEGSES